MVSVFSLCAISESQSNQLSVQRAPTIVVVVGAIASAHPKESTKHTHTQKAHTLTYSLGTTAFETVILNEKSLDEKK